MSIPIGARICACDAVCLETLAETFQAQPDCVDVEVMIDTQLEIESENETEADSEVMIETLLSLEEQVETEIFDREEKC